MKNKNEFDFNKHYGDEKETPPAFFWDDLEKQLPKKRKKRAAIFWITGIATVAASIVLATWGAGYFNTNKNIKTANQGDNVVNPTPLVQKENTKNPSNSLPQIAETENKQTANNSTPKTQKTEAKTGEANTKQAPSPTNSKNKDDIRLFTQKKETIPQLKQQKLAPQKEEPNKLTPAQPIEIELPSIDVEAEKWAEAETLPQDTANENESENSKKKWSLKNNIYFAAGGFAHTHTFSNFGSGVSLGIGIIKNINKNWEARIGLNYTTISSAGLQRTSLREHYFITKTTTKQQLDITNLSYFTARAKFYYTYKKLHFFSGLDAMFLVSSKSNLRTSETKYSEERITEQKDIIGYTKGVNTITTQLMLGMGIDIIDNLRAEMQLAHSITPFGSQSAFTQNNKLKLSQMGLGIHWRINK